MEVVNPFILKNKERMIVFLDQLSSVTDPNPPPGMFIEQNSNNLCSDTGKYLLTKTPYKCINYEFLWNVFNRSWIGNTSSHLRFLFATIAGTLKHYVDKKTGHCHWYADEAQTQISRNDKLS